MLQKKLKNKHLILGSASPRRQFFLKELGLDFEVRLREVQEQYPSHLKGPEISDYLAVLKSKPFLQELEKNDLLITADTIVWLDDEALGKPHDAAHAREMLGQLSGRSHEVISSVALSTMSDQWVINDTTRVKFKTLTLEEIDYYVANYRPFDKAGSYGIQEWIGFIGIERITGSYFNVMGFPTHKFYAKLMEI